MVRLPKSDNGPPEFKVVPSGAVNYYRWLGYILLADERDVRRADVEDVRKDDEQGRR
jgi:hypothetical protein